MTDRNAPLSKYNPHGHVTKDVCYIGAAIAAVGLIAANWQPTVLSSTSNYPESQQTNYRGWPFPFHAEITKSTIHTPYRMTPFGIVQEMSYVDRSTSNVSNYLLLFENAVIGSLLVLGTGIGLQRLLSCGKSPRLYQAGILMTCTLVVVLVFACLLQNPSIEKYVEESGVAYQIVPLAALVLTLRAAPTMLVFTFNQFSGMFRRLLETQVQQ